MARYLISRFFQALLVMFGVSLLIFFSLHLTGDPAAVMMPPGATTQEIADFRHAMGFDRPLLTQYADYAGHLLRGDLGIPCALASRSPRSLPSVCPPPRCWH